MFVKLIVFGGISLISYKIWKYKIKSFISNKEIIQLRKEYLENIKQNNLQFINNLFESSHFYNDIIKYGCYSESISNSNFELNNEEIKELIKSKSDNFIEYTFNSHINIYGHYVITITAIFLKN